MIGPVITSIIKNNQPVNELVGGRVFPAAAKETTSPSIYYIVQVTPGEVKNGQTMQDWRFTLITMCKNYVQSWELASKLIQAFQKANRSTVEGIKLTDLKCTNAVDDYEFNINTFGQKIEFTARTNNLKIT